MISKQRKMPAKQGPGRAESLRVFGHPGKAPKAALHAGLYARVSTNDVNVRF